ncbi:hypothetical protein EDB89DRAFT_2230401 [Lactarius sanguifluus]|nr:hypothetical protein EDB89DRAFT_2230401 [Lactarius sanguifluus]
MPDALVTGSLNDEQLYIYFRKLKLRALRDPVINPPPKRVRIHDVVDSDSLPGANTEHVYMAMMEAIASVSDLQTWVVEVQEVVGAPQRYDTAGLQLELQLTDPQGREQEIEVREELEWATEVHHELKQETETGSTHIAGPEVIRPPPTVQDPQYQGITGPALEIQAVDRQKTEEQSESVDIEHEERAIIRLTHPEPETLEQGSQAVEPPELGQTDSVVPGSDERINDIKQTLWKNYKETIDEEVRRRRCPLPPSCTSICVAVAVATVVSIIVDCRRRGPSSSWAVVVVRLTCLAIAAGVVTSLIAGVDPSGALAGVCLCCVAVTTVVVVQADTSRSWFMVDETQSFPRPVIAKHADRPTGSAQQYHHQQQQDSDNDNVVLDDATTTTERRQSTTTGATPVNYGNGATSTDIDSDSKTTPPPPTTTMTTMTTGDRDDYLDGELLCSI